MNPQYPGGYNQGPEQYYGPPPGSGGQYEFIMNQGKPPKRTIIPGNSLLSRIIVVVVILIVVTVVGIIGFNIATASSREYPRKLTSLAQTQQEIIRVTGLGIDTARAVDTRNLATNAQLTVITDQAALLAILKNYNIKSSEKLLAVKASKTTDAELNQALTQNRYDEVFLQLMNELLLDYKQELQSLYNQTKTSKEKALIEQSFNHMDLLIKE